MKQARKRAVEFDAKAEPFVFLSLPFAQPQPEKETQRPTKQPRLGPQPRADPGRDPRGERLEDGLCARQEGRGGAAVRRRSSVLFDPAARETCRRKKDELSLSLRRLSVSFSVYLSSPSLRQSERGQEREREIEREREKVFPESGNKRDRKMPNKEKKDKRALSHSLSLSGAFLSFLSLSVSTLCLY